MRKYLVTLTAILLFTCSSVFALHRDYKSDCEEDNRYQFYYQPYCLNHTPGNYQEWISSNLVKYIPAKGPLCCKCDSRSVYLGYLDVDFRKYRSHLIHQLEFCRENPKCHCYWPEYSSQAAEISDKAYLLFRDLIATTALSDLLENEDKQKKFIDNPGWFLNKHGLTISFIAQQFRFSDYYHICKDLENYALTKFERKEIAQIKDKLEDIIEALYPKFFSLYTTCYAKHPHNDIKQEIRLMKLLVGDISGLEDELTLANTTLHPHYDNGSYDISQLILDNLTTAEMIVDLEDKGIYKINKTTSIITPPVIQNDKLSLTSLSQQSEILLEQGILLNNLMLYKKAIPVLKQAIELNHSSREVYIERALAYFETNQIELALKDYQKIKHLSSPPFKAGLNEVVRAKYIPKDKSAFAKGLIEGARTGMKDMATEFIPSIFDCCRGILHGLWTIISSPEASKEMIDAAYAIGEFVSQNSALECLECIIPELKDLSLNWEKIGDYSRGQKIGYMIGKYGTDVFVPGATIKGIAKLKALKRANVVLTLEACAISQTERRHILKISADFAARRELEVREAVNAGRILIRSPNTKSHIIQPKHAWDKLIKISGNAEEDCRNVIKLLEENNIFLEKYRLEPSQTYKNFIR